MEWTYIFPILTTSVSFLFFLSVTEQYVRKRKPHQLAWSISMFLFFITAGAEAVSLLLGNWNTLVYRIYYLFAALQVSVMGVGLLYLFTRRRVIHGRNSAKAVIIFWLIWLLFSAMFVARDPIFNFVLIPTIILLTAAFGYLLVDYLDKKRNVEVSICSSCKRELSVDETCDTCEWGKVVESYQSSAYTKLWQRLFKNDNFAHLITINILVIFVLMNFFVWNSPLNESFLTTGKEVSGLPWQTDPTNLDEPRAIIRLFSPLHTVPGAIALIGGGIYSYISWQRSIKLNTGSYNRSKGVYNLYIAFGALVLASGATLSGYGLGTLYISEVISVTFMFYGFLESDKLTYKLFKDLFNFKWIWTREATN